MWEGIDGSSVLTHFPPADTYNSSGSLDQVCKSITNNKDLDRVNESLMLFGHGDGGGGPKLGMLEMSTRMQNLDGVPQVKFQSIHTFFQYYKVHLAIFANGPVNCTLNFIVGLIHPKQQSKNPIEKQKLHFVASEILRVLRHCCICRNLVQMFILLKHQFFVEISYVKSIS